MEGDPNNILITALTVIIVAAILYFRLKNVTKSKVVKGKGFMLLLPLIIVLLLAPLVFQGAGQFNWLWVIMFAILGGLLSILLLRFMRFELNKEDNQIYLQRDKRIILFILLLIPFKFFLRYIFQEVPVQELNMYFFVMGMSSISVWTVVTYTNFLQLKREREIHQD